MRPPRQKDNFCLRNRAYFYLPPKPGLTTAAPLVQAGRAATEDPGRTGRTSREAGAGNQSASAAQPPSMKAGQRSHAFRGHGKETKQNNQMIKARRSEGETLQTDHAIFLILLRGSTFIHFHVHSFINSSTGFPKLGQARHCFW